MFHKCLLKGLLSIYLCNYFAVESFAQQLGSTRSGDATIAIAQIIPDDTLGSDRSIVNPNTTVDEKSTEYIQGGAVRGDNLFHSFTEFNVGDRGQVYFASPSGIENIITRVTGNNLSEISGTLGVDGNANLFLLNPNGIIFNHNSQLDIAGSFLATTADSYIFANDSNYSAVNPQEPALLTVNIPVGLQFGSTPETIINRANILPDDATIETQDLPNLVVPEGLRIDAGETLSLIGGEVSLEGGYINTARGKIELGGVGANERVQLIPHGSSWTTDYKNVTEFANIEIARQGGIDGGNTGGSQIALTGRNISLGYSLGSVAELGYEVADFFSLESLPLLDELPPDKVNIIAHNQDNLVASHIAIAASDTFSIIDPGKLEKNILTYTSGSGDAGKIEVVADSIVLYGASLESSTLAGATGNSGLVSFSGQNMSIQYGGGGVNTFSQGNGGLIHLDIAKNVKLQFGGFGAEVKDSGDGGKIQVSTDTLEIQFGGFGSDSQGTGKGGTIQIDAQNLDIKYGGFGTSTFASGDGGIIDLNIANRLRVTSGGFGADALNEGNGGKIDIDTKYLELIDAGMGVNSRGQGTGGEIKITAETILLDNGVIGAQSGAVFDDRNRDGQDFDTNFTNTDAGDGGNIFVKGQSLIIDNGYISTSTAGKGNAGNIDIEVDSLEILGRDLITGISSSSAGIGKAGDIQITGDSLKLSNEGIISVDGGEIGSPGNVNIDSQDINLNRGGIISATTNQGSQGNITISGDRLFLSDRSQIITNATQDATGGNIFIDLQSNLLGIEGSKITASAENGQGGNIDIVATGIFFDADSQINASSDFGVDGLIQINTLAVDLSSGLIQLPTKLIDSSLYLSKGCGSQSQHEFVSVGRGGMPQNPLDRVAQQITIADLGDDRDRVNSSAKSEFTTSNANREIVEAREWKINRQGKIELIATVNKSNLKSAWRDNNCLN